MASLEKSGSASWSLKGSLWWTLSYITDEWSGKRKGEQGSLRQRYVSARAIQRNFLYDSRGKYNFIIGWVACGDYGETLRFVAWRIRGRSV